MSRDTSSTSRTQHYYDGKYQSGIEVEKKAKQLTRQLLPDTGSLRVLDIGCGTGLNSRYISSLGHSVYGIDISHEAIEKYKEQGFEGEVMDLEVGMTFADASFDVVYASEIIEHVVHYQKILEDIFRVLRPGGKLILSTPNSSFWVYRAGAMLGMTVSELQHPMHLRFFSKKGLIRAFRKCGFEIEHASGQNMYLLLPDVDFSPVGKLLKLCRFTREFRYTSKTYFWHLSHHSQKANELFADTLIFVAAKPR